MYIMNRLEICINSTNSNRKHLEKILDFKMPLLGRFCHYDDDQCQYILDTFGEEIAN